jgi:hypothetical protein
MVPNKDRSLGKRAIFACIEQDGKGWQFPFNTPSSGTKTATYYMQGGLGE